MGKKPRLVQIETRFFGIIHCALILLTNNIKWPPLKMGYLFFKTFHLSCASKKITFNTFGTYLKETWPLKKMYVSYTGPSCHNWFPDFLLVRQNSFTPASPQLIQWTVRINRFWQLGSVHKIHIHLEATSPFRIYNISSKLATDIICYSTYVLTESPIFAT